jgi:hypothetical protein
VGEASEWTLPGRRALREALRERLSALGTPLRLLAEGLRGEEEGLIDWVAVEPQGRAVVGLLEFGEAEPGLLSEGLAQRAWVAGRLSDWLKLAPGLGVRPELRPRLLLVAARFPRKFRIAVREADPGGIWLARYRPGPGDAIEIALVRPPETRSTGPGESSESAFRCGLTDADLGLTRDEVASLR